MIEDEEVHFWKTDRDSPPLLRGHHYFSLRCSYLHLNSCIMTTPSPRTVTHYYPPVEVDAMVKFYGGKNVPSRTTFGRSHTLDAALQSSNTRVSQYPIVSWAEDMPASFQ